MSHQMISFIKSILRITGYFYIPFDLWTAMVVLVVSEAVGIWEEIGH